MKLDGTPENVAADILTDMDNSLRASIDSFGAAGEIYMPARLIDLSLLCIYMPARLIDLSLIE